MNLMNLAGGRGFCRVLVSRANDLSGAEASAAEGRSWPWANGRVQLVFSCVQTLPADYGYILVQTAFVEVFDEYRLSSMGCVDHGRSYCCASPSG